MTVLGLVAAGVGGALVWKAFLPGSPGAGSTSSPAPESPEAATAAIPPPQTTVAVADGGGSPESLLEAVPLLSPEAARALVNASRERGTTLNDPLGVALHVGSSGFERLERAELEELSSLISGLVGAFPPGDRERVQAYIRYAREGEPLPPAQAEAGRAILVRGVGELPTHRRERLAELFGRAVVLGLQRQREAAERTRVATSVVPTPGPGDPGFVPNREWLASVQEQSATRPTAIQPSPPDRREDRTPGGGGRPRDSRRGEAYWRQRVESERAKVAQAEARVRELEEKAKSYGVYVPSPRLKECWDGAPMRPGEGVVEFRDRTKGMQTCDARAIAQNEAGRVNAQLNDAREALVRAEEAYEAFLEEARRGGALPGWLR